MLQISYAKTYRRDVIHPVIDGAGFLPFLPPLTFLKPLLHNFITA
jgi:hypothetical protein